MEDHEEKIKLQREKQKELISTLKSQLEELEKYAYETGEAGLPQSLVLERQKLILGNFVYYFLSIQIIYLSS